MNKLYEQDFNINNKISQLNIKIETKNDKQNNEIEKIKKKNK